MENLETFIDGDKSRFKSVGNAVGELRDSLGVATHQTSEAARKVINEVSETSKGVMKDYIHDGKRGLEYIERIVKDNPLTTILVSAAAGLLFAKLIKRV